MHGQGCPAVAHGGDPQDRAALRTTRVIKNYSVPHLIASCCSSKLIEKVAKEANVKVSQEKLYADGLGETGSNADTYQKMLVANTKAIVDGFGGEFKDFQK